MAKPAVRLLRLANCSIYQQLQLEEALLRSTSCNWLVLNDGSPGVSIVMGISGKVPHLLHPLAAHQRGVQVIKRFTGGGTVVVDCNTVFATLIMQADSVPEVECFPAPIMRWTEAFYAPAFLPHGPFKLEEHDYVFGNRKFGGNAQAITSRRWLHHTSFLWDYAAHNMALLKQPPKQPQYRLGRGHESFVVRLRDHLPSRSALLQGLLAAADLQFQVQEVTWMEASEALQGSHLRSNRLVDLTPYLLDPA